jgi:hypothetical protein
MKYLETMTGMSTINLSLYTDARPAAEPFINWSLIGHGFFTAAQILVRGLFVILQALLVIIPLAAIAGAAAWGVILLVRFARTRRGGPRQERMATRQERMATRQERMAKPARPPRR